MLKTLKLEWENIIPKLHGNEIVICPGENIEIVFSRDAAETFCMAVQKLFTKEDAAYNTESIDRKIKEVMEIDSQSFLNRSPEFAIALLNAQTKLLLAHMELMVSEKEQYHDF